MGCPGAGKEHKQATKSTLRVPQISTGDMLRQSIAEQTPLGLQVQAVMESGQLVNDQLIMELVAQRIQQEDCAQGFLFDGFLEHLNKRCLDQTKDRLGCCDQY